MNKEKLYSKNIGDMDKEELYEFCQLLLKTFKEFDYKKNFGYEEENNG